MSNVSAVLPDSPAARKISGTGFLSFLTNVPMFVWLIILVVLPNILLIAVSFMKAANGSVVFDFSLVNYQRAFSSQGVWVLLWRTLITAFLSTLIAFLIAYPMAYYTSKVLRRGRFIAVLLVIIPLWISLLMRTFAWRLILGDRGVLNNFLISQGIIDEPSTAFLYNSFAVLLTFVYASIPFIFISVYTAIERIPPDLIEAAKDSGASGFKAFYTVIWPLSKPGAAIGISLAFLTAVGDYITPSMVGGLNGTMLGMVISSQFGIAGNWPYGAALSIMLMIAVAILLAVLFKFFRVPGVLTGEGKTDANSVTPSGSLIKRWAGFSLFVLPYLFLYVPLLIIGVFSFNSSSVQVFPLEDLSLRWYQEMLTNEALLAALRRTLIVGAWVLLISVVAGTFFATLFTYGKMRGHRWFEQLLTLPVAIPGVVLGVTLVLTFQFLSIPNGIMRVVLGHCTFVMPVIMLSVLGRLRRLDPALVEASSDLGSKYWQSMVYIVLPLVRGSVIGGALLGLTLSIDEVVISMFLTGAEPTLPVWVWSQMRFGFTPSVNAIFVAIGIVSVVLTLVAKRLLENDKS